MTAGGRRPDIRGVKQAMFVIDADRCIRLRNARAAALLARRDLVFERHGAVACSDPESDRRLLAALRALGLGEKAGTTHAERRAIWLRGLDGRRATVILHAMDEVRDRRVVRALLTVMEPGVAPTVDVPVLAKTYDLTHAEARLAAMIASGHDTSHCARELGVKTSTLRTHLGSIYRKTGAGGMPDLVRLVLSLCAI